MNPTADCSVDRRPKPPDDLFTGDLLFVQPPLGETLLERLRAELLVWWYGSCYDDVAVVVRDPGPEARLGVVLMERGEPRHVTIDAWLSSRAWSRVVVRRTTTRALSYYKPDRVEAALAGVKRDCADCSGASSGLGFLPRWFHATGTADPPFSPRALSAATDATAWSESGLYEPDAPLF